MLASGPRRAGPAALIVVLLTLAACTSSSSDGSKGSATSDQATSTTTIVRPDGGPLERYADYTTKNYDDPKHWVCRPDQDICDSGLDATVGGGQHLPEPAADPPVDCRCLSHDLSDKGAFSDWEASDDEEGCVTLNQAARLQSQCRLFASTPGDPGAGRPHNDESLDKVTFPPMSSTPSGPTWPRTTAAEAVLIGHHRAQGCSTS